MADIFNIIYNGILFLWIQKIQVIGSAFVGLTIYEYFYRYYISPIRQKKLNKLLELLLESLIIMSEANRHDVEHEFLATKIEALSNEVAQNGDFFSKTIDANQRVLITQLNSEFEVVNMRLDRTDDKFKDAFLKIDDTIQDIAELKTDTEFIRIIKKYRIATGMALIGIISVTNFKQLQEWIKSLLPWH